MDSENMILCQDFNWHDAVGRGEYAVGEGGYLVADGCQGPIRRNRFLKQKITDNQGAVELHLKVIFGKSYHIMLCDASDGAVMDCLIDGDGWVKFRKAAEYVSSGKYITFGFGNPCVDPAFSTPGWYTRESDLIHFRFGGFDFEKGDLEFTITGPGLDESVTMNGCLSKGASEISKLELQTATGEPGGRIRLHRYVQYDNDAIVDDERFGHYWRALPAPLDGYPHDNMCETLLRPVDHRWLETSTFYGWVRTDMALVPEGEVTFEMKTPDTVVESAFELWDSGCETERQRLQNSERLPISEACHFILFLIMENRFGVCGETTRHSEVLGTDINVDTVHYLDEPVPVPGQPYRVKIAWDKTGHYRLWIDDAAMKINGSHRIPVRRHIGVGPFRGFDTLYLHPGFATCRETLAERNAGKRFFADSGPLQEPHRVYWAKFRLKEY